MMPGLNLRDDTYNDISDRKVVTESLVDMEDSRGKPRPNWVPGQCYLLRLDYEPF